jgi:transcriptional regulator with GAF, ATPase, and Fis domain
MVAEKAVLNPNLNVLLIGESGTGKRLFAQSIHKSSYGVNRPFVDVICNSFSEALLETELFGHEKHAFEGANVKKSGLFELADTGTIFFDGIDDIS